jgi:hypothetical protein
MASFLCLHFTQVYVTTERITEVDQIFAYGLSEIQFTRYTLYKLCPRVCTCVYSSQYLLKKSTYFRKTWWEHKTNIGKIFFVLSFPHHH